MIEHPIIVGNKTNTRRNLQNLQKLYFNLINLYICKIKRGMKFYLVFNFLPDP